ncbi:MAG: glycosyltransferase, partial [Thermodesulfobacteriota bacterium]
TRKIPSLIANWIISKLSNVKIHDHGCFLTVFKSKLFENFDFPSEFHRMIVPYLSIDGAKICEVPVSFTPRKYGKSKYGITRTFKVILDLISYLFFKSYSTRPMHFFGYTGFLFIFFGFISFIWSLYLKVGKEINFNKTPLPELIVILIVIGFQFILMGLLAEIFVKNLQKNNIDEKYKIQDKFQN